MPNNTILLAEAIALTAWIETGDHERFAPLLKQFLDGHITIEELRSAYPAKSIFGNHKYTPQPSDIPLN